MDGIEDAQRKLGVPVTGRWDAATTGAAAAFQQRGTGAQRMFPHGKVDPPTLVNLGYYDPVELLPARLRGPAGEAPTFFRDLRTASNQVPRWVWGLTALTFGVLAYMGFRRSGKREG